MATALPAGAGFSRWNLAFTYDYLGRRVQKTATNLDNGGLSYARRYLYNGWNLAAEVDATALTLRRSYTWGLDVAGSFSATGGVGALMQITDHVANKNYFPAYDHNGNVAALERDDGTLAAAYEYGPFGEPMRADVFDAVVQDNAFRYSTKFTDAESGLAYYGLRYYSPSLGRFINKDPIQESGGLNLYAFCGNNAVNGIDAFGLDWWDALVEALNKIIRYFSDPNGEYKNQQKQDQSKDPDAPTLLDPVIIYGTRGATASAARGAGSSAVGAASQQAGTNDSPSQTGQTGVGAGGGTQAPNNTDKKPDCAELRAKYAKYLKNGPQGYPTAAEANLNAALRTAQFGGDLAGHFDPRDFPDMTGSYYISERGFSAFFESEYVWGVTQSSLNGITQYSSTQSVSNNAFDRSYPTANPWIIAAQKNGTLYGIGHNHPNNSAMSGFGNGTNVLGGTDETNAIAYGSNYMIGATSGQQFEGTKNGYAPVEIPGVPEADVKALLGCIKSGK